MLYIHGSNRVSYPFLSVSVPGIDLNDGMVRMLMFRHSGYSSTSLEDFIGLMFRLEKASSE